MAATMVAVHTTGLELAQVYYRDVVERVLLTRWPELPHAAARLGSGSDVLGLDDAVSQDHDFGLRLTLLVERDRVEAVDDHLEQALPGTYRGWPTRFATSWDRRVRHKAQVTTAEEFALSRLGVPVDRPWDAIDWLALTGQSVLEVTAGAVFADTLGRITEIRRRLVWYPSDVWHYVVAADWQRIGQELSFVGRAGSRGDDLGSAVLTGQLVHRAMHLGFLLHRRWPPYAKWLGTRFAELPGAGAVIPALTAALGASTWTERQSALVAALEGLHEVQRAAGLPTGAEVIQAFIGRQFAAVAPSVGELLLSDVKDPLLRRLPAGMGSVEQWVDNVDVLSVPERRAAVARAATEAVAPAAGTAVRPAGQPPLAR